ncbi:MAG: glycoside hydrolase family 55 protein, partial [Duncaniella sp.]|nr:glycoside hydrolase family 55 protein [Duncaniella sp.]
MNIRNTIMALVALFAFQTLAAQEYTPSYKLIDAPGYYYEDYAVATYNVLDYGVDNTGTQDCTAEVQKLLDACGGVGIGSTSRGDYRNPAGGTLYFPAGRYLFKGQLVIPRGVSIRGDWKRPTPGDAKVEGTIFAVQPTRGKGVTSSNYAFIIMQPTTLISNISFWYPEQNPASIKKYPATVLYGQNGYWGNDYCNVRHCTFVNSYIGVQVNGGGGCPNVADLYGTPLFEGIEIDGIADVGRFDGLNFAASYWENSGLPGAPSVGQVDQWLYDNATAVVMRRNDWSYTCNLTVKGYKAGFHAEASPTEGSPNGHNYGFDLDGCRTGVLVTSSSGSGIMFADVTTRNCGTGVSLMSGASGPVQFYGCKFGASGKAIEMASNATSALMFQDCEMTAPVNVGGGHFQAVNNSFSADVTVDPQARIIFTDNKFTGNAQLHNNSLFKCVEEKSTGYTYPKLPTYEKSWMSVRTTTPARKALYVVTDAEFGAKPFTDIALEPSTQTDCAAAIQKALDKAAADGGGVVYLPTGHYPCRTELSIPTFVELKGSADIPT